MMRQSKCFYILNICIPLLIGGVIYYICCPDVFFVVLLDEFTGLNLHVNVDSGLYGMQLLRFYLFDALWAYSLTFAVFFVMGLEYKLPVLLWIIVFFEIVMEMLQLIPGGIGTFDIFDILLEVIITSVAIIFLYKRRRRYEKS